MEYVSLANGVKMPILGYGCFLVSPEETERCVREAMEEAYKAGKLRAIGVSNFYPDRLLDLASFSEIPPMVNQLETHLFQQHREDRALMEKYGAKLEAWSPFARGGNSLLTNPVLTELAAKHGKTAGQTALRFLIQSGVIAIPKSSHKERMAENLNIFDFMLSPEEMTQLEALDGGKNLFVNHRESAHIEDLFARFKVK